MTDQSRHRQKVCRKEHTMYAKELSLIKNYVELFDVARFEEIAADVMRGKGTNAKYTDMECLLHGIMERLYKAKKD